MGEIFTDLIGDWHRAVDAALKAAALFLTAAVVFRVTLRRTLAQFAPFDWVAAVAVGAIVGRTATATDASWLTGSAALVALLLTHFLVSRLRLLPGMRKIVDPPVLILIRAGAVDERNLRRAGISSSDLDGALRQHGYRSPVEVDLALLESRGTISFLRDLSPPDKSSG